MPRISDIITLIEEHAPLCLQESYDNAGMQVGDRNAEATGALLCLDATEAIVDEAVELGVNLIITHHPLIFHALKHITSSSPIERTVEKAIRNGIAIYSAHTNMDSASYGVSTHAAAKIGVRNMRPLIPHTGKLLKLVTFVPHEQAQAVAQAMWQAGAGSIGNYDCCSYTMSGNGTFRPKEGATPFVGIVGEHHTEPETRIEVIVPVWRKSAVLRAMLTAHPYEEPAYDIIALENETQTGLGVVGDIEPEDAMHLLKRVKEIFDVGAIAYSGLNAPTTVTRVAFCGGSAAEFTADAIAAGAQIYFTADARYHNFSSYADRIIFASIGHYESEHFTKEIFYEIISKKMPKFAVHYSSRETNPVKYM